jgi:hypothetical protein
MGKDDPIAPVRVTATNQNASPLPAYAAPEDAQLARVPRNRMVLAITRYNLPKPSADVSRAIILPMPKFSLDNSKLRDHRFFAAIRQMLKARCS